MYRLLQTLMLLLILGHGSAALALEWAGTVKAVNGSVVAERNGQHLSLSLGDKVYPQDKLITGKDGRIAVTLRDDTLISASANTQLVLNEFAFNPATQSGGLAVSVLRGITAFVSGLIAKSSPQAMNISTPTATLGIRGTEFIVDLDN